MNKQNIRWLYAAVGTVILLFAGLVYAWSVLSSPIAAEFPQWSQSELSLTFTLVMTFFCVGGLVAGVLAKKLSQKINIWVAGVLFVLGFVVSSYTQDLAALYLGFGVCCGFASGFCYNAVMSTVSRWFPDQQGLISGILLMGFGLGSFLIGKVYQATIPDAIDGWRVGFRVIGVVIVVLFAICGFLLNKPGADFRLPAAQQKKRVGKVLSESTTGQMLRTPTFWLYFVWAILLSASGLSLISQASGVAREVGTGVDAGTIATVVGLISIFNGLGRILFGGMFDRIGRSKTMLAISLAFIVTAILLVLALQTGSFVLIVIGFICGGLAYSGVTPSNSAFVNTYYGPKHYAVNLPMVNLNLIIASFGSTVAGALYDSTQSYFAVYLLMAGLAVAGILVSLGISVFDKKQHTYSKVK